ncbi:hypothetical protein [Herbiconiux solani]|uniref:hypothetical protein n=1 Tax=Herbiconiux solani TaxID=661329 RepID=UPI000825EF32|nr:hypothetical protein [Herbiconiux solani]
MDEANAGRTSGETGANGTPGRPRRPLLLILLALIVGAEAVVMIGVTIWLLLEVVTGQQTSIETALGILVLSAVAAVFLSFVAIHTLRARPWTRAATLVWQLLQIVTAFACFQGLVEDARVGWYLLVPAVLALVLLFTPPVVAATRRD